MKEKTAQNCLDFIGKCVSSYHTAEEAEKRFAEVGFQFLDERERWGLQKGKAYYVKRNDSSILAFRIPEKEIKGFHIVASHSDSPCFKLKTNPELLTENHYLRLNTEVYGGMIYSTWFDRCLSVAGRVVIRGEKEPVCVNVNIDRDLCVIPSLAIHMNREANKGTEFNPQTHLLSLLGEENAKGYLWQEIARQAGAAEEDILGTDLCLYVREKGKLAGPCDEWMISPRLDDLECVYGSMEAVLDAKPKEYVTVCVIFNNEEIGSLTREGAASTFLKDTLTRIGEAFSGSGEDYLRMLADSFMISADNAHALHPNYPEKADLTNKPVLNGGIVIKHHGGRRYTTDGYSEAIMKSVCMEAEVPCQSYHNRSDIPSGSTLGNLSLAQVAVPAVDIGLPQLAMHSAVETAGSRDVDYLIKALKVFYNK